MNDSKPLLDPLGVKLIAGGFVVGLGLIAFFCVLSAVMGQPLLVDHSAIPHQ